MISVLVCEFHRSVSWDQIFQLIGPCGVISPGSMVLHKCSPLHTIEADMTSTVLSELTQN